MKTSKKVKIIFISLLTVSPYVRSETRGEIDKLINQTDFQYNSQAGERFKIKQQSATSIYTDGQLPGFYEFSSDTYKTDILAQTTVSAFSKAPNFDSVLVVQVYCIIPDSIFPISPRHKPIKWQLLNMNDKKKSYDGEVELDSKGFARIRFNTIGSVNGKIIKIEIDETVKEIHLGKGPYEIFVPEPVCKKK